jgi:bacterioferritin-associated ferredoxin
VIVCSCNALSDVQILATLQSEDISQPRSAVQAYRCLGCAPRCGRCLTTVRALLTSARMTDCNVGCAACPATRHEHHHEQAEPEPAFLMAAE